MEIAMKISDGLMRDDAVRIVDLCMTANDLKTAQILFRAIHASWIRETVQRDHPNRCVTLACGEGWERVSPQRGNP